MAALISEYYVALLLCTMAISSIWFKNEKKIFNNRKKPHNKKKIKE